MISAFDPHATLHQHLGGDLTVLQHFIDALPVPCFVSDAQGRGVLVNQACSQAHGLPANWVRGDAFPPAHSPAQADMARAQDAQVFQAHETQRFESTCGNTLDGKYCQCETFKTPVFDAQQQPAFLIGITLDITRQKNLESQTSTELRLLEMLTTHAPLATLLGAYIKSFEANFVDVMCSVLLLDATGRLRHGAAPNLPKAYCNALDGVAIGPAVGSCGTAAYRRQTVIVSDIASDPLWQDYRDLALAHGLQACWSVPIISSQGQVLGTFANYYRTPRSPQAHQLQSIQRSAYLLGLAIEHNQIEQALALQKAALLESETRYRTLVEWSPEAVAVHRAGILIYVNAACITMLRASCAQDLLGRHIADLLHPDSRELGVARARQAMDEQVDAPAVEEKLLRLDGSAVDVDIQSKAIMYDGAPAVYVVAHDQSRRHADEETIRHLAFFDELTNLPNRRLMFDRLQQVLVGSAPQPQHGALLLLDLDNFKHANELLGHSAGDALLQQAALRLLACVLKGDNVGRVGGDEFMVLQDTLSSSTVQAAQQAETLAQKMLATLRQVYTLAGQSHSITPSIGVAVFTQDVDDPSNVIKKAEAAMYQAKAAGRNAVCFFDPAMQAQALARAEFEQDMREGFERHEFTLYYQIQVDVLGQPIGVEALVRWHSAKRGVVSPLDFIALAEENGMILPLGQYVLEAACAQLHTWAQYPTTAHWTIAVNVSARQFAQADFVSKLCLALQKTEANPLLLKLELTESTLVKDVDDVIAKMNAIKALGVSFSLDDFGTGYSSLSYLKLLPLDQLKIDQSFVRDLLTDPNDAVIARTIIGLGHSLGMRVIAEGVETSAQRDLLAGMDCDAFQGYHFGRPVPPAEFACFTS